MRLVEQGPIDYLILDYLAEVTMSILQKQKSADPGRGFASEYLGELVSGEVERFELPNLGALNFLLHHSLGGGGTVTLRTDAQGKTYGAALLNMEVEVE